MKEAVTTLPGSLGVNVPEWTTAHKNVPPEWLSQEGHPCMIGGRHGTMELQGDRLVCVVSPGPVTVTPKESTVFEADLSGLPIHQQLAHAVTRYDRRQEDAAKKNPKRYHNPHALGLYLGAAERAHEDIKKGMSVVDAVNTHFNGSLANHVHKALKTGGRYKEGVDTVDDVLTEGNSLRFSCPSRVQLSKAHMYFDVYVRNQSGLGNSKVSVMQGGQGNWFFDVTSHENNQFLDPSRLNGILPDGVTVTSGPSVTVGPQTASQDEVRSAIREMVEKRLIKTE